MELGHLVKTFRTKENWKIEFDNGISVVLSPRPGRSNEMRMRITAPKDVNFSCRKTTPETGWDANGSPVVEYD